MQKEVKIIEKLNEIIIKFMEDNFEFINLEVYDFINDEKIFYKQKFSEVDIFEIEKNNDPCALLENDALYRWEEFKSNKVDCFVKYILNSNILDDNNFNEKEIKLAVKYFSNNNKLVKKIEFNPIIKEAVIKGRTKIKSKELPKISDKFNPKIGDIKYIFDLRFSNNILSPCYIYKVTASKQLRVMILTNLDNNNNETERLNINGWKLKTVLPDFEFLVYNNPPTTQPSI